MLYYYSISGARDYILSKLIFNAALMIVMSITSLVLFRLMMGDVLQHPWRFTATVCLGGCSLSLVFSFLSAIAARARQNAAMIAILAERKLQHGQPATELDADIAPGLALA